ncbi:SapC family protein [Rhodoligotrophos defluvii]|uniref:SapC family protein n=1 Tax=Rhodoligotrophos defluvii TaxID=2561934 RepID=UPI0010C97BCA|nr:SapC family protein [Rhodoligotrophos defluvii]
MADENGAARPQGGASNGGSNFYRQVAILRLPQHKDLRLTRRLDFGFAAGVIAAPLTVSELALASRHYPIVFSQGETPTPIAVLGLRPGENLFVDAEGKWREGFYVPAHIRRYPFGLVQTPGTNTLSLAIDEASERVLLDGVDGEEDSDRLFDETGAPTALANAALELCRAMHRDLQPTDAYGKAMVHADLLAAKRADFKLPGNRNLKLDGFRVVDDQKFRDLSESMLPEWHRKGWLTFTSLHLVSRQNWNILAELFIARAKAADEARAAREAEQHEPETADREVEAARAEAEPAPVEG